MAAWSCRGKVSSERVRRCEGKVSYSTLKEAELDAYRVMCETGEKMNGYPCFQCGMFHIGHISKKRKARRVQIPKLPQPLVFGTRLGDVWPLSKGSNNQHGVK